MSLQPVILRPGLVWNLNERKYTIPLKVATDIGYYFNENVIKKVSPQSPLASILPQSSSINLSLLSDYAIKGALGKLTEEQTIWTNEDMNSYM
jgi:hypothetical protein